jgi:cobalt/nickel transport system ATP-binding protein
MAPIIEATQISYVYPSGEAALQEVSFSLTTGESLVILGANASGKSTLLHLLDGLIFPAGGEIKVFGEALTEKGLQDPACNARFRRRVGIVFQEADTQLFCPTVKDEIAFGPLQLGLAKTEVAGRVEEMLRLCGLEGREDRPPYSLSGGEKKKVALGSVLVLQPEILLLDEPTGGLDPRSQTWLVEMLLQLQEQGTTLITATHDLSVGAEIASRALVLGEDHRRKAEGTPQAILSDLDLLLSVNLIHEHTHAHGALRHRHPHAHGISHGHE